MTRVAASAGAGYRFSCGTISVRSGSAGKVGGRRCPQHGENGCGSIRTGGLRGGKVARRAGPECLPGCTAGAIRRRLEGRGRVRDRRWRHVASLATAGSPGPPATPGGRVASAPSSWRSSVTACSPTGPGACSPTAALPRTACLDVNACGFRVACRGDEHACPIGGHGGTDLLVCAPGSSPTASVVPAAATRPAAARRPRRGVRASKPAPRAGSPADRCTTAASPARQPPGPRRGRSPSSAGSSKARQCECANCRSCAGVRRWSRRGGWCSARARALTGRPAAQGGAAASTSSEGTAARGGPRAFLPGGDRGAPAERGAAPRRWRAAAASGLIRTGRATTLSDPARAVARRRPGSGGARPEEEVR
ncbi:MAG: hypothetical protein KatS3mg102_1254 [Planctomycetota bacterium]|nr:MAG: hypothetical protein KatS3mg102_1254 [Planctomycetota bacterium]